MFAVINSKVGAADSVMIENVIVFRMYGVDVFIAGEMCAFRSVIWVIWTYAGLSETIVVDNANEMFDSFITM